MKDTSKTLAVVIVVAYKRLSSVGTALLSATLKRWAWKYAGAESLRALKILVN